MFPSHDQFGRLRTSSLSTHLDLKNVSQKNGRLIDEEIGGAATSVHQASDSSVLMSVAANNEYVIRQSKGRGVHIAGKSYQAIMTMANLAPATDVLKRVGYFDSDTSGDFSTGLDGVCLESDGDGVYVCLYKAGTEIHRVRQDEWNRNKMDGSIKEEWKLSGADWDKSILLAVDFAWLGVGAIRFALMIDREFVLIHEITNFKALTGTFMRSPNKPLRYEIRSSGGTSSFKQICCASGS